MNRPMAISLSQHYIKKILHIHNVHHVPSYIHLKSLATLNASTCAIKKFRSWEVSMTPFVMIILLVVVYESENQLNNCNSVYMYMHNL